MTCRALYLLPFVATAGLLTMPAPAAATERESRSVEVAYGDLNLASENGAATLERRIRLAARSVCGRPEPTNLKLLMDAKACKKRAIAQAQPAIEAAVAQAKSRNAYASNDRSSLRVTAR